MEFEKYGACDAADALVAQGINNGGSIPYIRQVSGKKQTFAGPAYTVEYAPIDDPRPAVNKHYIDSVPKNSIVLVGTSSGCQLNVAPFTTLSNTLYGGLMSTRAKYLGARASVVLGSVRDVAEHNELEYPVFSFNVGVCAPNKLAKVVAVNEPLICYGRTVLPGDIVVCDENGVVVVPKENIEKALEYIPRRVHADALCAEDIKRGEPAAQSQKKRRAAL